VTVELRLALQERRAEELERHVRRLLGPFTGYELALDSGTGTGALAAALAPHVGTVVGVDSNAEYVAAARELGIGNAESVEGDATSLPFEYGRFDISGCLRLLHHVRRPELVVAEMTRVTRPGGTLLVVDQIAPNDPLAAVELNTFERARDPSHTRTLADVDLRQLFESNNLVLLRAEFVREHRELDPYLDLAGCEGEEREEARALAPADYTAELGWYLLRRP